MDEPPRSSPPRRWEAWVAIAVVVVPVLANGVRAWSEGWVPTWDTAFVQLRTLDVGTGRTPLVGMPSTVSEVTGQAVAHPGPLAFWLLAPPLRLLSWTASGLALAAAALNAAWLGLAVGMAALTRSRAVLWGTATALAVLVWVIGDEIPHDPWNPHLAVAAWSLAIVASALAMHGWGWALPVSALAVSFAAQAHLGFTVPAASVGIGAAAAVVARWARGDRRQAAPVIIAALVTLLAWSGPLLDQLRHRPGNLGALADSGGSGSVLGLGRAVERAVLVLRPAGLAVRRDVAAGDLVASPGWAGWLGALVVIVALGVATWWSWRRHSPLGSLGLVSAIALAAAVVSTAVMPVSLASLYGLHVARVWWPPAVAAWVVIVGSAGAELARRWRGRTQRLVGPLAAGVVGVAALVAASTWDLTDQRDGDWFMAVRMVTELVPDDVENEPLVLRTEGLELESQVAAGLLADLARRGFDVVAEGDLTAGLLHGDRRASGEVGRRALVLTADPADQPLAGVDELGQVAAVVRGGLDGIGGPETVMLRLTLEPAPEGTDPNRRESDE